MRESNYTDCIMKERLLKEQVYNVATIQNRYSRGKYILCESKHRNQTQLTVKRLNETANGCYEDGWCDTIIMTETPCNEGISICKIDYFKSDDNGHLICFVTPMKEITDLDLDSIVWDYFCKRSLFLAVYKKNSKFYRWNNFELNHRFAYLFKEIDEHEAHRHPFPIDLEQKKAFVLMDAFLTGIITLEDIEDALNKPFNTEQLANDICLHTATYAVKYPLTIKKIKVKSKNAALSIDEVLEFIKRKYVEYATIDLGNETDYLQRVEDVCQYWEARNQ